MTKVEDRLRAFGMSGFMITDELSNIERRFDVELGHITRSAIQDPVEYYPQFEQSVRSEAADMARHYELFYCLEKSIRKLISEALCESEGAEWWASGRVPEKITSDVEERIRRELDSGVTQRSDVSIDYTTFGELAVIITNNWDLFGTIFQSKRAVESVMSRLNVLRGPIAHCCPVSEDEIARLRLTVRDWFRMMG
ncbi:MAG: Swt1 family HEPN domain-containing protein [bacterium]|nr:Swt1 family HEPN domain-containing protein [bacterium]